MSSHDDVSTTEEFIKNLKAAAAASNEEATTNGNGVDHDDVSNGVDGGMEDGVDGGVHSKAPKVERSPSPQHEDRLGDREEPAPEAVKEHTPEVVVEHTPQVVEEHNPQVVEEHTPQVVVEHTPQVVVEHTPEVVVEHTPAAEEEPVTASADERIPDFAQLAVCPAKPDEDQDEVKEVEVRVPAARVRDEWLTKRQSSLEMKREVEAQSRPVISKAAMSTSIDEKSVRAAYEDVRSDANDAEWAVFKFEAQNIVCSATGVGFDEFRAHFADDERAFGFIRIQMGDEMSKRQKFVFLTWLGPQVSVIRRAKMSIDKAMVKNIVKNFAVELQVESLSEINVEYFREQLARAGGANYGTGFRD